MSAPRQLRQLSTRVMSLLMIGLGIALVVHLIVAGGRPLGILLGVMFVTAGARLAYRHSWSGQRHRPSR